MVNACDRDIRTLHMFEREEGLTEGELMYFVYRLVGDKFVLIIFSLNGTTEWRDDVLPKLAGTFGENRCRYESKELEPEPEEAPNGNSNRRGARNSR